MKQQEIKYNDNITLLPERDAIKGMKLKDDEYFALMVKDRYRGSSDKRDFFDKEKDWLALEWTNPSGIYITKGKNNYPFDSPRRGIPMVVRVKDTSKCCLLTLV